MVLDGEGRCVLGCFPRTFGGGGRREGVEVSVSPFHSVIES